jgi:hypothetical protein
MDPIGGSAVSRTLTVTSGGSGPLHVTAASVVGSGASDFTVTDDTCTAVAVATGSTCDITVAYNASNLSLPSVALVIDSDAARASRSIPIQASPTFSWSSDPGSVDFGTVPALSNATRTVTLTYLGDGSLTVTGFEFQATNLGVPPDFSVAAETCTATPIANGASCTIDVRFKPEAIGQEEGVLTMLGSSPIDVGGSSVAVIRGRGGYYVPSSAWNAPTVVTPSYTWNEGGALDRSSYTTSSYLHVLSMTDRVGSKWVTNSGPRMGVLYSRSSNGTTWSTARRLNSALTHGYWGTLTANYKYVDVAWVQSAKVYGVSGTAPRVLYFRHNGNHGSSTSWGAAKRITSTTGRIDHPSITSSGSRILLAWTDSSTGAIRMALSKDRGATFSISTVGTTARYTSLGKSGHPVVTLDGTTAIVAWLSSSSGAIRSRISTTSGSTWGTTSTVSNASIGVPTVAAGSGRAAVAFEYGDAFVRVWKSGWKPTIVLQPNEGTNYSFFYAPAIGFNGSKLGAAWSGCLNDGSSDCSNLSESTATHLLWAESPDDGAHWSQGAIVGSAYVSGARHLNDVPSINWSTKRYLVWNGSTIDTNYYRIFAAAGATIATAAALTPAVTVPTVSVQSDPPAGVSSLGCEPLPAIAPLVESLGRPEADRAGC